MIQQDIKEDLTQQDINALVEECGTLIDKLQVLTRLKFTAYRKKKNYKTLNAIADNIFRFSKMHPPKTLETIFNRSKEVRDEKDCEYVTLLVLRNIVADVADFQTDKDAQATLESARYLTAFNRVLRCSIWLGSGHYDESYRHIAVSLYKKINELGLLDTLERLVYITRNLEYYYMKHYNEYAKTE